MRLLDTDSGGTTATTRFVDDRTRPSSSRPHHHRSSASQTTSFGLFSLSAAASLVSDDDDERPKKRVRFSVDLTTTKTFEPYGGDIDGGDESAGASPTASAQAEDLFPSTPGKDAEEEDESCPPKKQRQSRHHPLRQKLWWTKEERLKILESCREMGEEFKTSKPDLVQDYLDLYEEACCLSPVATSPSSSPPTDDVVTFPAHARGLEWCIAPSTRSHRRQHVEDIVEKQHQLRRTPIGRDKREQILSRRSIQSSRPSRLLAQWTGQMDYRKHQQEEEQT